MTLALTLNEVAKLRPCAKRWEHAQSILPKRRKITAQMARDAGCTFDDMVWLASAVARNDRTVERRLQHWLADCAAHVLHIYERDYPSDMRVRYAINAAREYADGRIDDAALDAAQDAARAAARAALIASQDAARAAARAALIAAQDAARAAWDAARGAALAAARGAWDAALAAARGAARGAALAAEEAWQFDRLIAWLSEDEPMPLGLPEPGKVAA